MAFAIILGVAGTVVLIGILRAFVFSFLWAWFIVPLGAPPIGVAHAMGLALILALLTTKPDLEERDSAAAMTRFGKAIFQGTLGALLAFGIGFTLHVIAA